MRFEFFSSAFFVFGRRPPERTALPKDSSGECHQILPKHAVVGNAICSACSRGNVEREGRGLRGWSFLPEGHGTKCVHIFSNIARDGMGELGRWWSKLFVGH